MLPASAHRAAGGRMVRHLLSGATAGAAGTTALNAVTYVDMALRGRAASTTPEQTVETLLHRAGIDVPGDADTRGSRLEALGAVAGLAAGVGTGVALGGLRALGWRPGPVGLFLAATAAALVVGNGPMTALGITDPRRWTADGWVTDLVPHVAYGLAAAYVLNRVDDL